MTDTAEFWNDVHHHYVKPVKEFKRKKYPEHFCVPKEVPDGTPFKWFCIICGRKINKQNYLHSTKE